MEVYEISIFSIENYLNDTAEFSEDMREIYMEKFTKIRTSELRWDIYGLNKDDPDIYGFLCHWQQC